MITTMQTPSTPTPAFARNANHAGAPLPHLPRRTSSASRAAARAASFAVSDAPFAPASSSASGTALPAGAVSASAGGATVLLRTPTHAAPRPVPAQITLQPPTPPQPQPRPEDTESDDAADDADVITIRARRALSQPPAAASLPAPVRALVAFPTTPDPARRTPSPALRPSARPLVSHGHSRSMFVTPVASPGAPRVLKSSLKVRAGTLRVAMPAAPDAVSVLTKSEPATPVKAVKFDAQLEHVKLFLAQQRPSMVSRDGSPVYDDTSGTDSDWPAFVFGNNGGSAPAQGKGEPVMQLLDAPAPEARSGEDVVLESLALSAASGVVSGTVRVRNLAFEKHVAVRFTLDGWQTTSEVAGKYERSAGAFDRFAFALRIADALALARIEDRVLEVAVRYATAGRELWDNNNGKNYRATFVRRAPPAPAPSPMAASSSSSSSSAHNGMASVPVVPHRLPRRRGKVLTGLSDEEKADLGAKLEQVARSSEDEAARRPHRAAFYPDDDDDDDDEAGLSPHPPPIFSGEFTDDAPLDFRGRYDFAGASRAPWRPASPQFASPAQQQQQQDSRAVRGRAQTQPVPSPTPAGPAPAPAWVGVGGRRVRARAALGDVFAGMPAVRGSPRAWDDAPADDTSTDKAARGAQQQHRRHHARSYGYFDVPVGAPTAGGRSPDGSGFFTRYNSFPCTRPEALASPRSSPAGTPLGGPLGAPGPVPACVAPSPALLQPVPHKALVRASWDAALVLPASAARRTTVSPVAGADASAPVSGGGTPQSTPSITSGESSSRESSPTPSLGELVVDFLARARAADDNDNDADDRMLSAPATPVGRRGASPVDETYTAFLDRFCFFTGPHGTGAGAAPEIVRAHSASSVEELLSSPPAPAIAAAWAHSAQALAVEQQHTPSRPSSADSFMTIHGSIMVSPP